MRPPSLTRILAFAILTDDDPVQVRLVRGCVDRCGDPGEEDDRSAIDYRVEKGSISDHSKLNVCARGKESGTYRIVGRSVAWVVIAPTTRYDLTPCHYERSAFS